MWFPLSNINQYSSNNSSRWGSYLLTAAAAKIGATSPQTFCSTNIEEWIQKCREKRTRAFSACLQDSNYKLSYFKSEATIGDCSDQPSCAIKCKKTQQMVLPTLTGTPVSREAREARADVGRATSVHTLSTLRNVTTMCACLTVVYGIFNSCRLDVQESESLNFLPQSWSL